MSDDLGRIPWRCLAAVLLSILGLGIGARAGAEGASAHKLSLRLSAGPRWTSLGDLGTHAEELDKYLYALCGHADYLPGELERTGPWSPEGNLEISLDLRPGFSVSIGAGFSRVAESGESLGVTFFEPGPPIDFRSVVTVLRSRVDIIPISLGISRRWPVARRVSFVGGVGVCAVLVSADLDREMTFRPLLVNPNVGVVWPGLDDRFRTHGIGFGPTGSAGLELSLGRSLSLLLEVEGRYARVGRLTGRQSYFYYSPVDPEYFVEGENEGTLQIGTSDKSVMGLPEGFPDLSVVPSASMKRARLDLSGFSCRLGFAVML